MPAALNWRLSRCSKRFRWTSFVTFALAQLATEHGFGHSYVLHAELPSQKYGLNAEMLAFSKRIRVEL